MSSNAPGRREVAHRLFAAEFDDADYSYSESDEERAPNYVVTPTGARVNRLFVAGVVTEVTRAGENILRARVVDPTGAFVVYAGQYQPEAMAFLEEVDPPTFVAVTGKARTFQPEDSDIVYTSIRPESVSEIDAATRDRWTVTAAERTLERLAVFDAALDAGLSGSALTEALSAAGVDDSLAAGIPIAVERYGTSRAYLAALQDLSLDATRLIAGEVDAVTPLDTAPDAGDAPFTPALATDVDLSGTVAPGTTAASTDVEGGAEEGGEPPTPADEPDPAGESAATTDEEPTGDTGETEPGATAETAEPAASETAAPDDETVDATPDEPSTVTADPEPTGAQTDAAAEPVPTETTEPTESREEPSESVESRPGDAAIDADDEPAEAADADDELGDFDPGEFDLDEETRQEVEDEFGTEFSTGSEVDPAGEADIEPEAPAAEEGVDTEEADAAQPAEGDEPAAAEPVESTDEPTDVEPEAAEPESEPADVSVDEVLLATMRELDDGDGAPRDDLVAQVADATAASPDEVEDAIQDALMSGQCYEPSDGRLKPI
ncbi:hypothetical protein [Halomarina ordinaria]|uniref:Rpa-associated protein n=1 Tax=Halomarina ordinaria TaxID=3033939 RepID=A0ABD5U5L8_9EURY|nr:hypothetical protein [Halomarina sp. PSRA2]